MTRESETNGLGEAFYKIQSKPLVFQLSINIAQRMRKKVLIWGASGHSIVVADILRLLPEYEIVGLIDSVNPEKHGKWIAGLPVLGGCEQLERLKHNGLTHLIFGFGDCNARLRLAEIIKSIGLEFATAVHPRAVIAEDVRIGEGTVIAAGAVVNPGTQIGANSIINTCASVDHECIIGEAAHIGPGTCLAGGVKVGRCVWIGIGATVLDQRQIGDNSIVGAGSLITKDVKPNVLVYGVPARTIRTVEAQHKRKQQLNRTCHE